MAPAARSPHKPQYSAAQYGYIALSRLKGPTHVEFMLRLFVIFSILNDHIGCNSLGTQRNLDPNREVSSSPQPINRSLSSPSKSVNIRKKDEPIATRSAVVKERKANPIDLSHFFREDIENYPEDEIRTVLKRTPDELRDLFNVINTHLDPNMNLTERIAHHYNAADDYESAREESICRTVMRNIYPRQARRENSLVYVPNNQEFMQVIQAEICQFPDQDCNYLQDSLPYGMTSVCHQKYSYKKLLYLDPLEKRMASDLFRYPSCCSCHIRSTSLDLRTISKQQASSSKSKNNDTNITDYFGPSSSGSKLELDVDNTTSHVAPNDSLIITNPEPRLLASETRESRSKKGHSTASGTISTRDSS